MVNGIYDGILFPEQHTPSVGQRLSTPDTMLFYPDPLLALQTHIEMALFLFVRLKHFG